MLFLFDVCVSPHTQLVSVGVRSVDMTGGIHGVWSLLLCSVLDYWFMHLYHFSVVKKKRQNNHANKSTRYHSSLIKSCRMYVYIHTSHWWAMKCNYFDLWNSDYYYVTCNVAFKRKFVIRSRQVFSLHHHSYMYQEVPACNKTWFKRFM